MLKISFVCVVLPTFILHASTENIQIQSLHKTVIYKENDLVITCSIINPSELSSITYIQLQKNISTTFETVVSVATGQTPPIQWKDTALQNRATATGNLDSPTTAQLRFMIDKSHVRCSDFKAYKCKMTGFGITSGAVTQETTPITISYIANPSVIEMPMVKFLNEPINTPCRSFPLGAVIQFTCEGFVGSDPHNTIRWCSKKSYENSYTELESINTDAKFFDCQYTRSSKIIYNFTSDDMFTQFLCESGYVGACRTGTAIQYVNITFATPTKMMSPRVGILNKINDTSDRQFPVATAITLFCQGEVGSDPKNTIRWCAQKVNQNKYTELSLIPVHSEASLSGCQYTRSSSITYNLNSEDTLTKFLCESGYTGICGTGTAIQYLNISTDVPAKTTKDDFAEKTEDYSITKHIGWIVGVLFPCISISITLGITFLRCSSSDNQQSKTS